MHGQGMGHGGPNGDSHTDDMNGCECGCEHEHEPGHSRGHGHGRRRGHGRGGYPPHGKILGTTTIGERGQVVIPAEAREELGIQSGEKFVVFGNKRKGSVVLVRAEVFNKFADFFMTKSKKLEQFAQEILDATNSETADYDDYEDIDADHGQQEAESGETEPS